MYPILAKKMCFCVMMEPVATWRTVGEDAAANMVEEKAAHPTRHSCVSQDAKECLDAALYIE